MKAYLGIGSNVGERLSFILKSLEEIKKLGKIVKLSTVYESKAWGIENQPPFLNLVLLIDTKLPPTELLLKLKGIEKKVGRRERYKWGPREIDIDIILYGREVINSKLLKVPHPFLTERDFFLYPLLEIEKDILHPLTGKPLKEYRPKNTLKPFCCILKV
ncbi:2-amino-4-hydroxy-6-hydroxymethyldihydropteridine diphosphokinase [Aquifex pyrophilus]